MNVFKKACKIRLCLLRGKQSGFALPLAILIIVVVLVIGGGVYLYQKSGFKGCTEEAKVCPDGSTVGRIGPTCEFAECPKEEIKPTPTQIKSNSPYITLLSPNGGEVWENGKTYEIKWELKNVNTTVKEISIAAINEPVIGEVAVEDVIKIASVTGQDVLKGIYKWQIPNNIKPSNRYSIEISIADQDFWKKIWAEVPDPVSFSDFSNGFISIVNKSVQNWKTYRNEGYGYEVRYPLDWKFEKRSLMPNLGGLDFVGFQSDEDKFSIEIWDFSFYSYDQLTEPPPGGIDPDTIEKKEIIIDSQPATELSYVAVGNGGLGARRVRVVFIQKNQLLYKIRGTDSKKCDQILSTFKFIK